MKAEIYEKRRNEALRFFKEASIEYPISFKGTTYLWMPSIRPNYGVYMPEKKCADLYEAEAFIDAIKNNMLEEIIFKPNEYFKDAYGVFNYISPKKARNIIYFSNLLCSDKITNFISCSNEAYSARLAFDEVRSFLGSAGIFDGDIYIGFEETEKNRVINNENLKASGKLFQENQKPTIDEILNILIPEFKRGHSKYVPVDRKYSSFVFNAKHALSSLDRYANEKRPDSFQFRHAADAVFVFYAFIQCSVNEHIDNRLLLSKRHRLKNDDSIYKALNIKESCEVLIEELEGDIAGLSAEIACNAHELASYVAENYPKKESWQKFDLLCDLLPALKINGLACGEGTIFAYICKK